MSCAALPSTIQPQPPPWRCLPARGWRPRTPPWLPTSHSLSASQQGCPHTHLDDVSQRAVGGGIGRLHALPLGAQAQRGGLQGRVGAQKGWREGVPRRGCTRCAGGEARSRTCGAGCGGSASPHCAGSRHREAVQRPRGPAASRIKNTCAPKVGTACAVRAWNLRLVYCPPGISWRYTSEEEQYKLDCRAAQGGAGRAQRAGRCSVSGEP